MLVERCQMGDSAAFEELYRHYYSRLYRFCFKRLGDPHEAEDVAQEAFAKAWRAIATLGGERRFYPWISVIAGRMCIDVGRRSARSKPVSPDDFGSFSDRGSLPEEIAASRAGEQAIWQAVGRLPERPREALALRAHEDWSYERIATYYGISMANVKTLLWRARSHLREELAGVAGVDGRWGVLPGAVLALARLARRVPGIGMKQVRQGVRGPLRGLRAAGGNLAVMAAVGVTAIGAAFVISSPPVGRAGWTPANSGAGRAVTSFRTPEKGPPLAKGAPAGIPPSPPPPVSGGAALPRSAPAGAPTWHMGSVRLTTAGQAGNDAMQQPVRVSVPGLVAGSDPLGVLGQSASRLGGYPTRISPALAPVLAAVGKLP
ncbi:MAG: sigma-70 family RNA polymerase sigma factor [Actinomycetota bacterium]|nr:sigma-70 family RNA polymerase sigma factor [Actinomycetota bacterium]